eukprot:gnl/TRDRNA2_/TRDRNA2_178008_c0_seq1.p1 gnl/TRDRNA2_/TRDRNA2_178008_c0~~gnl/TRDRNA2_/TRDRNA2_178008_c0_seq1.p1  ORF type:complete len:495 (+),score=94.08 gnl/TRDRNA2_/TRDRNA2_178008_c0_seq1:147-1487(+)
MARAMTAGNTDVNKIINRLVDFADQKPVMRAFAKLLRRVLRPEQEMHVADLFRSIDIHGDGSLDCNEIIAIAANRREDIRRAFMLLDQDGSYGLDFQEFLLSNCTHEDMLNERMLEEAFGLLDTDGNGQITVETMFHVLLDCHPDLTPHDVELFMSSKNWEMKIDFQVFRGFFPKVANEKQTQIQSHERLNKVRGILTETFDKIKWETGEWLSKINQYAEVLEGFRVQNRGEEKGGSRRLCEKTVVQLQEIIRLLKRPPTVLPPAECEGIYGNRRQLKTLIRGRYSGIFALDLHLHSHRERWQASVQSCIDKIEMDLSEDAVTRVQRQEMLTQTFKMIFKTIDELRRSSQANLDEQTALLDSINTAEEELPKRPWSRAGIDNPDFEKIAETQKIISEHLQEHHEYVDEDTGEVVEAVHADGSGGGTVGPRATLGSIAEAVKKKLGY